MNSCKPPLDPAIALILLAAGRARRFGSDKRRADCGGRPLIHWAMAAAEQAGFAARLVVVPPGRPPFDLAPSGWRIVENPAPEEGLASSIRVGVAAVRTARRVVIALADMPLVEPDHLRALALTDMACFTAYPGGKAGVPAAFPARDIAQLLQLKGDRGAAALLPDTGSSQLTPANPQSLLDVDTPEALAAASARLAALRG